MRLVFTVAVASVLAIAGSIEDAHAQVASIGAYGGVNRATLDGAPPVTSPIAGVRFALGLGGSFSLGGAVEYSGGGVHLVSPGGDPGSAINYDVGYLAAPIGMRLQLGQGSIPFHVSVGTTIGALLFATETMNGAERDVRGELAPFELTADVGAGFAIPLTSRVSLDFEGRWSLALIDGVKRDAAIDVDSWKTRDIQILAGITFTLNPRAPAMPAMPGMPFASN